jgi:hypothetical protein
MRFPFTLLSFLIIGPTAVLGQTYKVELSKQSPPASLSPEIAATLGAESYRISDEQGKAFADLWFRKGLPATSKPVGPQGTVQFPFLEESQLLGVIQFVAEGHDYRDQTIAKGVYTLRYGLQPVNGDHLGVSPYRDYVLLLPASKDRTLATIPRKQFETQSAESAGSSHPAVFLMTLPPSSSNPSAASMVHDEEKNTWKVVIPLNLAVKGTPTPVSYPVAIIVVGAAET